MPSLYEATVPGIEQTVGAMAGLLARGRAFCRERDLDPDDLAAARLCETMKPLRFQVRAALHFSLGSLAALRTGVLGVPDDVTAYGYAALEALVAAALVELGGVTPAEVDEAAGRTVVFHAGERRPAFTGQGLLLSFALPNLHFHATTAYAIMRMRGVDLGQRDDLGRLALIG